MLGNAGTLKAELPGSLCQIFRTYVTGLCLHPGTRTFMLYVRGSKNNLSFIYIYIYIHTHTINLVEFKLNSTSNYYCNINLMFYVLLNSVTLTNNCV